MKSLNHDKFIMSRFSDLHHLITKTRQLIMSHFSDPIIGTLKRDKKKYHDVIFFVGL